MLADACLIFKRKFSYADTRLAIQRFPFKTSKNDKGYKKQMKKTKHNEGKTITESKKKGIRIKK